MLTKREIANTAKELQENARRLDYSQERILADTQLSAAQYDAVLSMNSPEPAHVWMVRDYLEEMLDKEGKTVYPWTRLADHNANKWFAYSKPWKNK